MIASKLIYPNKTNLGFGNCTCELGPWLYLEKLGKSL